MKKQILLASLLALLVAGPVRADDRAMLPATAGDLVPTHLLASEPAAAGRLDARAPRMRIERRPVHVSWALPAGSALQPVPQPFARPSREYWTDVSATELQRGVELPLTAPGAVIRLSPSDVRGGRLQADGVQLRIGGHTLSGTRASRTVAGARTLAATGMTVPEASLVMQLRPELGAGPVRLQAAGASGRYVVHVFEPRSALTVTALADRDDLLLGQRLHVEVSLREGDRTRPLQAAGGFLRSPDGTTTVLDYRDDGAGHFSVDAVPLHASGVPGLWELHSFTVGDDGQGHAVRRDTTSVFAVAVPDARLSGLASTRRAADRGIDITLGLIAASGSRFAVSGVLYGRGGDGHLVAGAYAQSAAWVAPGDGALVLHFDPASLAGISAPYELRDLRLQDQPAVSTVERRALALRFAQP
ncbi:DUF4785 domain-containing protein [Dyella sp.]|uniref:DUF4785 domain-containing protein n=1 Tax=Dyella sp. TaxID=1869338 RepID=UPI002D79978E|nr:DUF4785 domain-containing protein [Dyella sp.]HET6433537.1 DUF4785 domain-containing protein [Dyella sp.]